VDQPGKDPAFYAAGWKNKVNQVPADPHALFKIASIYNRIVRILRRNA
jgi:D-alanyl-D-alanine carboxypeptidase